MKNKEYLSDIIVILVMTAFVLLVNEMNWAEKYMGFGLLPLLTVYYVGKYLGNKFAKKETDQ